MTREEWDKLMPDEQWLAYERSVAKRLDFLSARVLNPGHYSSDWNPLIDDKGNLPPPGIQGDMTPTWYDGRWWVNWTTYCERKRVNGERP